MALGRPFPHLSFYVTISAKDIAMLEFKATPQENGSLTGQLLIAMPGMPDRRFTKTVVYLCAHNSEGAMGLVVNRVLDTMTFPDLLEQVGIPPIPPEQRIDVHFGGPVETGRGFVLHSPEYMKEGTLVVDNHVVLTATIDILRDMAAGQGPDRTLVALGYTGWGPGQLNSEIEANGWLHVEADNDLLFGTDMEAKWEHAMTKLGIDPRMLSDEAGHT